MHHLELPWVTPAQDISELVALSDTVISAWQMRSPDPNKLSASNYILWTPLATRKQWVYSVRTALVMSLSSSRLREPKGNKRSAIAARSWATSGPNVHNHPSGCLWCGSGHQYKECPGCRNVSTYSRHSGNLLADYNSHPL